MKIWLIAGAIISEKPICRFTVQIMLFSADNSIDNNGNAVDEYNIRIVQEGGAQYTECYGVHHASLEDLLPNGGLNIHPTDKAPIAEALVKAVIACAIFPGDLQSGAAESIPTVSRFL